MDTFRTALVFDIAVEYIVRIYLPLSLMYWIQILFQARVQISLEYEE